MRVVDNPLSIQSLWDQCFSLQKEKYPFATSNWHINYLAKYQSNAEPLFFIDESLMVVAPFTIYNNKAQFSGGKEISDYMDLVGNSDNFELMWHKLLPELKSLGCKSLDLFNVSESSPTLNFFTIFKEKSPDAIVIEREDTTPIVALPESFVQFTHSLPHKQRHELERKLRKFDREHPDCIIEKSSNLNESMDRLLELMSFHEHKKDFLTTDNISFFKLLPAAFPDSLTFYSLLLNNSAVASVVGFKMDDTFYLYNTGFNLHEFPGAGFYIHTRAIEQEILAGTKFYNFLQGNERYKYDLGGKDKLVFRIEANIN